MGFQKHKTGFIVTILCLLVLAAAVWFCLLYIGDDTSPEGTFVEWREDWPEVMT